MLINASSGKDMPTAASPGQAQGPSPAASTGPSGTGAPRTTVHDPLVVDGVKVERENKPTVLGRPYTWRDWVMGRRPDVPPLPGRPPRADAPSVSPDVDPPLTAHNGASAPPPREVRAVACSGGGIRAAAFSLGGIQGLGSRSADEKSWLDQVDLVTAVSGGSYIAGSYAMVNHTLQDARRAPLVPAQTTADTREGSRPLHAYAAGSPEDQYLRTHTRYLVEDPKIAATGVLNIVYGLVLNLAPLLALVFLAAVAAGTLIRAFDLIQVNGSWQAVGLSEQAMVAGVIAASGLALYAAERFRDIYRRPSGCTNVLTSWALRLFALALLWLAVMVGVPALVSWLRNSDVVVPSVVSWQEQLSAFAASVIVIVTAVKGALGRFKGKVQTPDSKAEPGLVGRGIRAISRRLAPWLGSLVVAALFVLGFTLWAGRAATQDLDSSAFGMAVAIGILLLWPALTDVNRNSVHPFYRARLSSAFFKRDRKRDKATKDLVDPPAGIEVAYAEPISLSEYAQDTPQIVICAAVNSDEEGRAPSGRGCAPFTFSPMFCGISSGQLFQGERALREAMVTHLQSHADIKPGQRLGDGTVMPLMIPTGSYEAIAGKRTVTLPSAVAVSGAAISPAMGRQNRAPLRLLLGIANVRLGLWLPNPVFPPPRPQLRARTHDAAGREGVADRLARGAEKLLVQVRQPGVPALLREMFGRTALTGDYVYVTDGGHYENLGLVEALRRGATEVIVFDASGDRPYSWTALGQAVQTARADLGVEIDVDPRPMRPAKDGQGAPTLVAKGTYTFPDGTTGSLYYCKLALPDNAPLSWDVLAYAGRDKSFPNTSTANQLYGDEAFEAYRRLGELAAQTAISMHGAPAGTVKEIGADAAYEIELQWPPVQRGGRPRGDKAPLLLRGKLSRQT